MSRRRRRNLLLGRLAALSVLGAVGFLGWKFWPFGADPASVESGDAAPGEPVAESASGAPDGSFRFAADEELTPISGPPLAPETEGSLPIEAGLARSDGTSEPPGAGSIDAPDGEGGASPSAALTDGGTGESGVSEAAALAPLSDDPQVNDALQRYARGQRLEARAELNRLLHATASASTQREIRQHLSRIAEETLFAGAALAGDPLVERYTVQSGDVLERIAPRVHVPAEIVMRVNNISDPRRLRAGQSLMLPRGPFHVVISVSQFRLDVYLQDLYVRSFPVGLGAAGGTPIGKWVVKDRLTNPTYYPPASAGTKRVISPDDPSNPLGERWIGLEGVDGAARGQVGYGIHGTIEPDSIGKAASLGCVRMHNDDVAFVYSLLLPRHSQVVTRP